MKAPEVILRKGRLWKNEYEGDMKKYEGIMKCNQMTNYQAM